LIRRIAGIPTDTQSLFGDFDQLFDLLITEQSLLGVGDDHEFDVLIAGLDHVEQRLHHQSQSLLVAQALPVVLLQELAHLLRVAPAGLRLPLREGTRGVGVVEVGAGGRVEASQQAADAEGTHSALLRVLLLRFSDELGNVLDRRTVVVVEAVALALDSRLVCEDSSVGSEAGVGHVDVVIELHDLLDGFAVLQLGHCLLLSGERVTSTARMTEVLVTSPTAHSPFLTASMAYSTWKRWPLGEKTVIAVSYI
jgi:hypothetical protein